MRLLTVGNVLMTSDFDDLKVERMKWQKLMGEE